VQLLNKLIKKKVGIYFFLKNEHTIKKILQGNDGTAVWRSFADVSRGSIST